jgi:hypothetical protein
VRKTRWFGGPLLLILKTMGCSIKAAYRRKRIRASFLVSKDMQLKIIELALGRNLKGLAFMPWKGITSRIRLLFLRRWFVTIFSPLFTLIIH